MENKIDIAEILRNCPQGMELYSPLCGKCVFDRLTPYMGTIICKKQNTQEITFTKEGYYMTPVFNDCECMLFPSKDQRDWSKFQRPFKDGDVLFVDCSDDEDKSYKYIFILNKPEFYGKWHSYCHLDGVGHFHSKETYLTDDEYHPRFATEEEKAKFFDAIKANGHRWDDETKTLEKLTPKFKDGDIISDSLGTCIFKGEGVIQGTVDYYCGISCDRFSIQQNGHYGYIADYRLATEEEKAKLFETIKANGYKWDDATKTLEKLIEPKPKFKVGDRIKYRSGEIVYRIVQITEDSYVLDNLCSIPILIEHMYNLVPNKFDINSLVAFESKVLVRDKNTDEWRGHFFSHYDNNSDRPYICIGVEGINEYMQCIPYEGNEHLLGKTYDCDSFYKTW